jgi:hypothetical protein
MARTGGLVVTMFDWMHQPENKFRAFHQYLESKSPATPRVFFSENERDFIEAVDLALEIAIRRLEENAASHNGLGELTLSTMLSDLIQQALIPCEKEPYRNGHVDIAISHPFKQFQCLGECKIFNGYKTQWNGCDQLLHRYSSGRDSRGFVLGFFRQPEMYALLATLKARFDKEFPHEMKGSSTPHSHIKGAFVTLHTHFTKTDIEVLHLGCNLHVPGLTKSKTSKKASAKRASKRIRRSSFT